MQPEPERDRYNVAVLMTLATRPPAAIDVVAYGYTYGRRFGTDNCVVPVGGSRMWDREESDREKCGVESREIAHGLKDSGPEAGQDSEGRSGERYLLDDDDEDNRGTDAHQGI